jgi:trimeric autotransporter adhesin
MINKKTLSGLLFILCLTATISVKAQVEIVSGGTASAYTLNVPAVFPLRNGVQVTFKANVVCGNSPTIDVTGTGAILIKKDGGANDLVAGDIKAGQVVNLVYDGTFWQMLSGLGNTAASVRWDQILAPTANLNLIHGTNTTNFTFNGLSTGNAFTLSSNSITSGTVLNLSSASTAGTGSSNSFMLNISRSGANVNASHNAVGISSSVSNTGVTSTNVAGSFSANGASTENYGIQSIVFGSGGSNYGVYGQNSSTGTGTSQYGVYGQKVGNTGTSNGYGVFGTATGTGTTNYGGSFTASGASTNIAVNLVSSNIAMRMNGSGSGTLDISPAPITASYALTMPTAQGAANTVLANNGSGTLSWSTVSSLANAWSLTGNAGTVDGTNYIGTTDNVPFNIRVFGQKAGRIENTNANTFIGYQAGNSNTGINNNAFGYQALFTNSTGGSNSATGLQALYNNTTGSNNVADGFLTMVMNTTGSNNTAIGYHALTSNKAGSNATAIGYNAMYYADDQTGAHTNNNVALGYEALKGSTTAASNTGLANTAIGYQTLWANSSGSGNTVVGATSMSTNTTGTDNASLGASALLSNTTGNYNLAAGTSAMLNNITGSSNVAVGREAMYTNNAGSNAVAIGTSAMRYANNTGTAFINYNVAVGFEALRGSITASANTGNYNTATGYQSLMSYTTGAGNVANGAYALNTNNAGGSNTAVGMYSMNGNTSGNNNSALGYSSLNSNTTGSMNIALGREALFSNLSGNQNIALGYQAGYNTTGSGNVFLGHSAGFNETGSNKLYIANSGTVTPMIYGDFSTGNVGLGMNAPAGRLHSSGQIRTGIPSTGLGGAAASTGSILFYSAATPNTVNIQAGATSSNYTLTLPTSQGAPNTVLTNDGIGTLSWNTVASLANAWSLTGNAGTIPGTNFLGTTDAQPLMFKVSGQKAGYIDYDGTKGNTGLGYQTLNAISTGTNNTAVGHHALVVNNTGNSNAAFGVGALSSNTSGSFNTALGMEALRQNTTGVNNTASGYQALLQNTTGNYNTAHGMYVLYANINGGSNTGVGFGALSANINGSSNTGLGSSALGANTYASGNIAIGQDAMGLQSYANANTVWSTENVAIGNRALYSNQPTSSSNGYFNTAVGNSALTSNTVGYFNTALGYQAGYTNSTGNINTFVGWRSGYNTNADNNAFLGYLSGFGNTSGSYNVFSGTAAGYGNSTGFGNSYYGGTVAYNTNGSFNSFMGYQTGYSATSGDYNTMIGSNAGGSTITLGTYNTYLGYNASGSASLTNATAIGKNAIVTASNSMSLGGTGSDAVKVGIGVSSPNTKLEINGDLSYYEVVFNTTTNPISNASIGASTSFVTITGETANYAISGIANGFNGKVLTIYNNTAFTMTLNNLNTGSNVANRIITGTGSDLTVGQDGSITLIYSGSRNRWIVYSNQTNPNTAGGPWTKTGTNIYQTSLTDLVGIGTATPVYPLDVTLATGGYTHAKFGTTNSLYMIANSPQIGFNIYYNGGWKYGSGGAGGTISFGQEVGQGFSINTAVSGVQDALSPLTSRLAVTNTGDVGIGNTSPALNVAANTQLTVSASTTNASKVSGLNLQGSTAALYGNISSLSTYNVDAGNTNQKITEIMSSTDGASNFGKFYIGTNNGSGVQTNMIMDHTGKTVFQTASNAITLSNVLHVYESNSNSAGTDGSFINIHNGATTTGTANPPAIMTGIRFKNTNWAANQNFKGGIFFQTLSTRTHGVGNMIFALSNDDATDANVAASDDIMTITPVGNVGIGGAPGATYRLHVQRPSDYGPDHAGIYSIRSGSNTATNGGNGWGSANVDAAIKTFNTWGDNFTASGYFNGYTDYANSTALMAFNQSTSAWDAFQYKDGANVVWAGYFNGNVHVNGTLSKAAGAFRIDDPLDPENKYLYHSFVESPDMMNVYNGNIVTDANGYATVELPDYFESLNKDFRYQLTVLGEFAQAIVFEKVSANKFKIKTDKPNIEVSWQVTGIRKDPYAEQNRIPNTVEKTGAEKGKYLYPKGYNKPESMGINYSPPPAETRKE